MAPAISISTSNFAEHQPTRQTGEAVSMLEQACQWRCTSALGDDLLVLQVHRDRFLDRIVRHHEHVVHQRIDDLTGHHPGVLDGDAFGDRGAVRLGRCMAFPSSCPVVSGDLHADDLHMRRERLQRDSDAADEATTAHGYQDHVDLRDIGEQFETDRALSGDHERVVERVDRDEASAGGQLGGVGGRPLEVVAVKYHFGTEHPRA